MASDLKLEIFAFQFFQSLWRRSGVSLQNISVLSMYPDEYNLDPENAEIWDESYILAASVKEIFYWFIFHDELMKIAPEFEYSPSYVFEYISRTCRREGVFRDLTIFELFFTSCSLVSYLSLTCFYHFGYKDVIGYAHICWAAYFDQYTEEFYRQGGWSQLKIVSASYAPVYEFLFTFPNKNLKTIEDRQAYVIDIMEVVSNYKTYMSDVYANCKTVSKTWVKFHPQSFTKSDRAATEDAIQNTKNPHVMEKFLLKFRRLCDPFIYEELINSALRKQFTEAISQSLLKLNNLTLNNTTSNTCKTKIKQIKVEPTFQENDDQTDKLVKINLSGVEKGDDQANKLVTIDISRNKDTTSNACENVSFLKLKGINTDDVSQDKTQIAIEQKLNNEIKREIDVERDRPEVKCLLRMILALGDREGTAQLRSLLFPV
ncbi:uncharacterized protein TNIN_201111 [Trichonephila inaurata madagascariensis]|uniref:Uncharacterized protein n=1 Tax=Trichonephila inaurata madagascariensis TaxID=2747483 RepID=A0A8X6YYE0_9ARAC|nr:uncharacterized protein TNIN_201111 [Trichonephila inaurata madagascariensis]